VPVPLEPGAGDSDGVDEPEPDTRTGVRVAEGEDEAGTSDGDTLYDGVAVTDVVPVGEQVAVGEGDEVGDAEGDGPPKNPTTVTVDASRAAGHPASPSRWGRHRRSYPSRAKASHRTVNVAVPAVICQNVGVVVVTSVALRVQYTCCCSGVSPIANALDASVNVALRGAVGTRVSNPTAGPPTNVDGTRPVFPHPIGGEPDRQSVVFSTVVVGHAAALELNA